MQSTLPILDIRDRIVAALYAGRTLILRAPTGSGKSTQTPQIVLDSVRCEGQILVLQPRRLAARMLAARVAAERKVELGDEVGFQTRFERFVSKNTRIRFITEGILPRLLMRDRALTGIGAVIFDEFHERSLTTDIGLGLIRRLQQTRPNLFLIVMSATLETGPLQTYLPDAECIEAAGSLHPVDIRYRSGARAVPIWEHAAHAARELVAEGAGGDILTFMPGAFEIRRTIASLQSTLSERVRLLPLYGELPAQKQREVMTPDPARRTIIVATNIAETSLTIPGVRHVIDSGLARMQRHDPARGFNTLFIEPISEHAARQRAGRAGREGPGICVRLWSAAEQSARPLRTPPEIHRVDLAEAALLLHMLGFQQLSVFPWFEPPDDLPLQTAESLLVELGAIAENSRDLTQRGALMSAFPMHPRLAALVIESSRRGAPRLGTLAAAALSERLPAYGKSMQPRGKSREQASSDFIELSFLIDQARQTGFDPARCSRLNINISAAKQVLRTQALFLQICRGTGLPVHQGDERPDGFARAMLAAYPDHCARRRDRGTLICDLRDGRRGELDKNSCARGADLLIAASIRETRTKQGVRAILSLATEIREEWLEELFPDRVRREQEHVWNSAKRIVERKLRCWRLGVLMSEENSGDIDPAAAGEILANAIIQSSLPLKGWNAAANEWIKRTQWLGEQFPQMNLPRFTPEDRTLIIHTLCSGRSRYDQVHNKPVLPLIQEMLSWEQRRFVEAHAPTSLALPSGRKMRILYEPGQPPRGRARIQDLYDLTQTPRVAEGKYPVLLEILAPNMRAVQVTDNLARFWDVHYPEIKQQLARRYPKHEWR